jgi:serine protease Do
MKADQQFFQLLDDYHKGQLSDEEILRFRERMNQDEEFRREAESYLDLMKTIKQHGERQKLKRTLDDVHDEMKALKPASQSIPVYTGMFKKYWRMTAVAASISVLSVAGTLFITDSLEKKQKADYRALRRNVEQIQRSQKQIIADLAENKENEQVPGKYSGTGFLISANGYVATSYHVIKESDSVAIENEVYGRLKASVVYSNAENDISILKIVTPGFKVKQSLPFTVSQKEADLGEYVYTLGFPREDIVFGEGSVSASTGFRQDPDAYQVSVPVNPGNSGGPLLNTNGDLIGMVSGVQTETAGAAFAIKSSRLLDIVKHEAIDTLKLPLTLPKKNIIREARRVEQIRKLRAFVFMVRVYKDR